LAVGLRLPFGLDAVGPDPNRSRLSSPSGGRRYRWKSPRRLFGAQIRV